MIVLDTHIWVRWVDPSANPLPTRLIETIESADQLAITAGKWLGWLGAVV